MFTGIIEAQATLLTLKKTTRGTRLVLSVPASFAKLPMGSSVAVNGVCLTVSGRGTGRLSFDLLKETMKRSSFGSLRPGDRLNLERALRWGKRIEGHFVQGHADARGRVLKVLSGAREKSFQVSFPRVLKRFFVKKGSVAINGVSLTLGRVAPGSFWVHLIPTTLRRTNLGRLKAGDTVNLETDLLLKFFRRLTSPRGRYKLSGIKN